MKRKTKIFWMLLALGLGLFALGGPGCAVPLEREADSWEQGAESLEGMHAAYVDAYGPNIRYWPEDAQRAWREAFEKRQEEGDEDEEVSR